MQCVNCGFENIPGMRACVRCQSSLILDEVIVAPPRARSRVGTAWRQCCNVVRSAVATGVRALPQWTRATPDAYGIQWEAVVASIVPGLGHIRYGRKATGQLLLGAWACLMLGALVTLGLGSSQLFLAGAVGVHAMALMSWLGPMISNSNLFVRIVFGTLVFAGIRLGVYYPAGSLIERFYQPFPVMGMTAGPVIQNHDVLLCYGPWARSLRSLNRGDLVIYEFPEIRNTLYGNVRLADGYGLDRIVGLPGDHVQVIKGVLLVNGKTPPQQLSPIGSMKDCEGLDVPAGDHYVILPSRLPLRIQGIREPERIMSALSAVPREAIVGKVALRIQPWSRFGHVQ